MTITTGIRLNVWSGMLMRIFER